MTLAGSTVAGLAGCGGSAQAHDAVTTVPQIVRQTDVELFNRSLDLERRSIAAYTAGIPLLTGTEAKAAEQFLSQEMEHAGELLALIHAAGGTAIPRVASYNLGHPRTAREVLALLYQFENRQIAAYVDAIPKLSPGLVRGSVASILANDAQHVSVLRLGLGSSPTPSAFVTGRE
jgi:bacterioferritin (cytochrome b1)